MKLLTYQCLYQKDLPALSELDPNFWQEAISLVRAEDGEAPANPTKMRCFWNEDYLGVYFYAIDHDIWGSYTEPDDPIYREEVVEVFLAPFPNDLVNYFELELSPRNVPFSAKITNNGKVNVDLSWTPNWETEVFIQGTLDNREDRDEFWLAKMLLPLADFNVNVHPGDRWRGNFFRIDREPDEHSAWSPVFTNPANFHTPQRFGEILFLR